MLGTSLRHQLVGPFVEVVGTTVDGSSQHSDIGLLSNRSVFIEYARRLALRARVCDCDMDFEKRDNGRLSTARGNEKDTDEYFW